MRCARFLVVYISARLSAHTQNTLVYSISISRGNVATRFGCGSSILMILLSQFFFQRVPVNEFCKSVENCQIVIVRSQRVTRCRSRTRTSKPLPRMMPPPRKYNAVSLCDLFSNRKVTLMIQNPAKESIAYRHQNLTSFMREHY